MDWSPHKVQLTDYGRGLYLGPAEQVNNINPKMLIVAIEITVKVQTLFITLYISNFCPLSNICLSSARQMSCRVPLMHFVCIFIIMLHMQLFSHLVFFYLKRISDYWSLFWSYFVYSFNALLHGSVCKKFLLT